MTTLAAVRTEPPKRRRETAVIHLRTKTENGLGGMYLISICGVRQLETLQSRLRITKALPRVTCAACLVRMRGGKTRTNL